MAQLPVGRSHLEWATFVHNGKILSVSGVDGVKTVAGTNYKVPVTQNSIYEYNPATNQWTKLADLPRSLASPGAKIINGIMYVFGGGENDWFGGDLKTTWARPYSELVGGPQPPASPIARAGNDITTVDTDGNGSESVTLDGTQSTTAGGTIVSYHWLVNGNQVATGATTSAVFPVGVRTVTLEVVNNAGLSATDNVVVSVNAGGGQGTDVGVVTEAEDRDSHNGIGIATVGPRTKLVNINDAEWVSYTAFDFGPVSPGVKSVDISVSSNTTGGIISFRLGTSTGATIATIDFSGSNGWEDFVTLSTDLVAPVSGVQDLFIFFTAHPGETRSLMDVDWFQFNADTLPNPPDPNGVVLYENPFATTTTFTNTSHITLGGNGAATLLTPVLRQCDGEGHPLIDRGNQGHRRRRDAGSFAGGTVAWQRARRSGSEDDRPVPGC